MIRHTREPFSRETKILASVVQQVQFGFSVYLGDSSVGDEFLMQKAFSAGLFSKALRDTSKRLSVPTLRGMGISEESIWAEVRYLKQ